MSSQIPIHHLPATPKTPKRRCRAQEANVAAASPLGDDDLRTWVAELFGEVTPPVSLQTPPEELVESYQKCAKPPLSNMPGMILRGGSVTSMAHVLLTAESLDEEVELCWPLSKEIEGPPGPQLAAFKRFHYRVWKMFGSAEDLMTDEYLEVSLSQFGSQIFCVHHRAPRCSAAETTSALSACCVNICLRTRTQTPRAKSGMLWSNKPWPTRPATPRCSAETSFKSHRTTYPLWSSMFCTLHKPRGPSSEVALLSKRRTLELKTQRLQRDQSRKGS
jgi:hypothetical protein